MIRRQILLFALIVIVLTGLVLLLLRPSIAQSGQQPSQLPSSPSTRADSTPLWKWEYRILSDDAQYIGGRSSFDTKTHKLVRVSPSLEEQINELAKQGYEVESLEATGPLREWQSQVIVLLKRERK